MRIDLVRKGIYDLLALAFRRPTPPQVEALTSAEAAGLLEAAIGLLPSTVISTGARYFRRFLREAKTEGLATMAHSSTLEYCRLFIGPYALPCPPYGSVYLDDGQVMGPSAVDVLSRYRQEALHIVTAWAEPPDHIAVELEFMAFLSARYAAAAGSGRQQEAQHLLNVQREFLRDHLGRWGPIFAGRLVHATSCHLYRFLGEFLPTWLAFDRDLLEAIAAAELGIGCV